MILLRLCVTIPSNPLQDMGHHYAMQLLAAPLDTPRHAKGVTVLRGLLQRCQLAGSPELRTAVAEVLPKARALLAPEEQVSGSRLTRCMQA